MAYIGQSIKNGTFTDLGFSGTFNSSTTAFSLGTQVGSPAQLLVSKNGVIQRPGTDYTLSSGGASITFTTAPASGDSIFIVEISGAVGGPLGSDLNGSELILDADGDTSLHASTDDQIDVKIAGADDFKFTANSMNVLSGSTLTIDSGATITNSGTATGFPGITMVNMWHRPSNFSLSANTYTTVTGLQKLSITGAGNFGSDMTESSGIFTFPSTGIYKVEFMFNIFGAGGLYSGARLQTTVDNSSYVTVSEGYNNQYTTDAGSFGVIPYHFDVTNTTTHKVKFLAVAHGNSNLGGGSLLYSGAIFTRLGDT